MVPKERITLARLSCKQSKTDKVHVQIDFLVDLKAEHLVADQTLANYRKSPANQRYAHAVFVDKIEFLKVLDKAESGGGSKRKASSKDEG